MLVLTQVSSMNTRREGGSRPSWAFHRARFRATSGRVCSSGSAVFFEAQALGVNEHPHGLRMGLDPPLGQLRRQTPQRKRPRADPRTQPLGALARERPWLVAADLSRGQRAGLLLALRPFGHARRTDAQRRGNLAVRLASRFPGQRAFPKVNRIGSRHPYWPPPPAWTLNHNIPDSGIPIPSNHALL